MFSYHGTNGLTATTLCGMCGGHGCWPGAGRFVPLARGQVCWGGCGLGQYGTEPHYST